MSRHGITRWAGPHCLDEPCFDKGFTSVPRKLTGKKKVDAEEAKQKKEKHQARLRRYRNNYRGSISEGFQRYVIVDKTPVVSTPVVDQPK
jgi:hypothetical protein